MTKKDIVLQHLTHWDPYFAGSDLYRNPGYYEEEAVSIARKIRKSSSDEEIAAVMARELAPMVEPEPFDWEGCKEYAVYIWMDLTS